jgi:hypothetical protein
MSDAFRTALGRAEERLTAQQDRLFERFERGLDRLEAKFDQRIDASDKEVQAEFRETRLALGELRDGIALQRSRIDEMDTHRDDNMRASAEGAARGAGEAAGAVATRAAAVVASGRDPPFSKTPLGKLALVCGGIMTVLAVFGAVPGIIKYGGLILAFLGGLAK